MGRSEGFTPHSLFKTSSGSEGRDLCLLVLAASPPGQRRIGFVKSSNIRPENAKLLNLVAQRTFSTRRLGRRNLRSWVALGQSASPSASFSTYLPDSSYT